MIDRSSCVYPVVSAEEWAAQYGIILDPCPCPVCKKPVVPSIPFAVKGYRGLSTAYHGCDANGAPHYMVPVGKKELKLWQSIGDIFK